MAYHFFGLAPKINVNELTGEITEDYSHVSKLNVSIHNEVHQLIFFGKGGYTWEQAYFTIPVHLRRYYLNLIIDYMKKEEEEMNKAKKGSNSSPTIHRPNIRKPSSSYKKK